jgi:hypothetical protein
MNIIALEKTGAGIAALFAIRVIARWRVESKQRAERALPLVDPILVETLFAPRPTDGDDPDVLAEVRNTVLHLNRRGYAEEFWGLHAQLTTWHNQLPQPGQQETFRRALLRLLRCDDRWLQIVAAKTCAALKMREAIEPLRVLLAKALVADSTPSKPTAEGRYREELETALKGLEPT